MEVRCDKCQARYRVDDARVGPQGLTMRCGKCQNTFKVTRDPAQAGAPEAAKAASAPKPAAATPSRPAPAAKPAEAGGAATMMFSAPVVSAPPAPAKPAAKPATPAVPPAPKAPAASKPSAPAPADEGAGRTMMFQTGSSVKVPAAPRSAQPKPAAPENDSGATMVFGQAPVAAAATKPAAKPAPSKPAAAPENESGATMVFGQSPIAVPREQPPAAEEAAAQEPPPSAGTAEARTDESLRAAETEPAGEPAAQEPNAEPGNEPNAEPAASARSSHDPQEEGGIHVEGMESEEPTPSEPPPEESTFDKAPPKGLLIGVGVGLAALILAGVALVAMKKLGHRAPPPAAVEQLGAAQAAADKDSLAALADAEAKARDAIEQAGPKARFPEAPATLAVIEVQWADALKDQAKLLADKTAAESDEAKKAAADAKVAELQAQAKVKIKAAFDAATPAAKANDKDKSPEVELALAECYRFQGAGPNMNKQLKKAQALKADPAKVALVQGEALAQEEDGAEKALPRLKVALAGAPDSARIHFRIALANLSLHNDAEAMRELKETLRLSPQHERARMAMEQLATQPSAEQK
jgi:predicted Zn finger-like uncharacterized protein